MRLVPALLAVIVLASMCISISSNRVTATFDVEYSYDLKNGAINIGNIQKTALERTGPDLTVDVLEMPPTECKKYVSLVVLVPGSGEEPLVREMPVKRADCDVDKIRFAYEGIPWTIKFTTTGKAYLAATPINGSAFGNLHDTSRVGDLTFGQLLCGAVPVEMTRSEESMVVPNYSCDVASSLRVDITKPGTHYLMLQMGDQTDYTNKTTSNQPAENVNATLFSKAMFRVKVRNILEDDLDPQEFVIVVDDPDLGRIKWAS